MTGKLAAALMAVVCLAGCETLMGKQAPPAPPPKPIAAAPAAVAPPPVAVPAPAPAPQPPPAKPSASDPPKIEGMKQDEILAQLGTPASQRELSPARVFDYRARGCTISIYLYFDTGRADFFALHYDFNGKAGPSREAERCLETIAANARRS
jgi:hypothetical protein